MHLHISKNIDALSHSLADWIVKDIQKILKEKEHYDLVLSGGSTPKALYKLLASLPWREQIEWNKIRFFMGDERYVPFEDNRNNGKMAFENLLNYVPVLKDNVYLMDTTLAPEASARMYEKLLHDLYDGQPATFDLVLLGMGDDGHTLSLFPGTEVVHETEKWVAAPFVKVQDMHRITLTQTPVKKANAVAFLTTGNKKAKTLKEVLQGSYQPDKYPSQVINSMNKNVHWFMDDAAASKLEN